MTHAVCFHCGEMKWGAFTACKNCGARPKSDDDLMLSIMLTNHNLSSDQLAYYGRSIKAGKPPLIRESEKAKLRPVLEEAKVLLGIKRPAAPAGRSKWLKATAAFLIFVVAYFLVSALIFLIVLYINGGSVFSEMNWRAFGIAAFANAWAGYLAVFAGREILDRWLESYPMRFVGISFIVLLSLWFVPLTLIYIAGGVGMLSGMDLEGWPPEGELSEFFLGLVRAVVAVVCTWVMLVKRDARQPD